MVSSRSIHHVPYIKRLDPKTSEDASDAHAQSGFLTFSECHSIGPAAELYTGTRPSASGDALAAVDSPAPLVTTALPAAQLTPEPGSQLLVPAPSPSATAHPSPSQNAHQTVSDLPSGRSPAMASQTPIGNGTPVVVHDETSTPMDLSSALPSVPSAPRGSQKRPSEQSAPDSCSANSGSQGKRSCLTTDHPVVSTPGSVCYKATIKALAPTSLTEIPNRIIQASLDACLGTAGFRGFTARKKSNTIAVWLPTLAAVERLQTLQRLSITSEITVPVQVYLVEGSDLQLCVVYNVDVGEDQTALQRELCCPTHRVIQARGRRP
ncbi:uncharacterized protein [Dermacentor albipictus]|uniref:uncharacterized protein n=1 Tax=Dermacentor albipictus TaxID=60249 RepID=UPI0038FC3BFC